MVAPIPLQDIPHNWTCWVIVYYVRVRAYIWLEACMTSNYWFLIHSTISGGGPRGVVSTAAFHARVRGSVPGLGVLTKKCFFPIHVWNSLLWGASVTEMYRTWPQTARVRISNPVSGGQCHLIHLTILRRFSWPSLAYVHKGGLKPDSFHFFSTWSRPHLGSLCILC